MNNSNLFFILSFSFLFAAFNNPPNITGKWISKGENGKGIVEIYQSADGKVQGKFVKALNEEHQKKMEKAMAQSNKKELLVLRNFEYAGNNIWDNGTVFSPKRKKELTGTLKLISEDELEVSGSFFGYSKSFIWKRIP